MPRSLSWRIALGFAFLGLATWVAIGGALFLLLRSLHADATSARLADLGTPLVMQSRPLQTAAEPRRSLIALRDQVAGQGFALYLVLADGRILRLPEDPEPPNTLRVAEGTARGAVERGTFRGDDGQQWAWAAFTLRNPTQPGPRALILATPDRSGAEALRDLLAAVPAVILASIVVGAPIALLLARSVTQPLRRLARASADLPRRGAEPLPLEGPLEVQEVTANFNAMTAELGETKRREAELLANLRHDLRTPVTVIAGFAAALNDGTASGDDVGRASRAIAQEAERLESLVGELGAVERLESGDVGLRPEALDVGALLAAAADRFAARAAGAGVRVVVRDRLDGIVVTADRQALERMLANLIANALVAVGDPAVRDPGTGHVWLGARRIRRSDEAFHSIVIDVTDNGLGFPPGSLERVFDRFYRADVARSRSTGGSGLGLSIVRDLARAHGGDAFAENVAPGGARVSVVLPEVPVVPAGWSAQARSPRPGN